MSRYGSLFTIYSFERGEAGKAKFGKNKFAESWELLQQFPSAKKWIMCKELSNFARKMQGCNSACRPESSLKLADKSMHFLMIKVDVFIFNGKVKF